jgi:hypothetical protein
MYHFIGDISDRWFPPNQRTIATCIGSFINQVGLNFGFIFATIFFMDVEIGEDNVRKQKQMNLFSATMNTVAFLICVGFIRDKPKTPPSYTSVTNNTLYA